MRIFSGILQFFILPILGAAFFSPLQVAGKRRLPIPGLNGWIGSLFPLILLPAFRKCRQFNPAYAGSFIVASLATLSGLGQLAYHFLNERPSLDSPWFLALPASFLVFGVLFGGSIFRLGKRLDEAPSQSKKWVLQWSTGRWAWMGALGGILLISGIENLPTYNSTDIDGYNIQQIFESLKFFGFPLMVSLIAGGGFGRGLIAGLVAGATAWYVYPYNTEETLIFAIVAVLAATINVVVWKLLFKFQLWYSLGLSAALVILYIGKFGDVEQVKTQASQFGIEDHGVFLMSWDMLVFVIAGFVFWLPALRLASRP